MTTQPQVPQVSRQADKRASLDPELICSAASLSAFPIRSWAVPTPPNSMLVEFSPTRAVPTKNSPNTFRLASLGSLLT